MTQEQIVVAIKHTCIPEDMWHNQSLIDYWLKRPNLSEFLNKRIAMLTPDEQVQLEHELWQARPVVQ